MNPPVIIAIETSGRRGSVALGQGPELIGEISFPADTDHARDLIPSVDRLCRQHTIRPKDLDHCYLSIGPGSFTGLRIAVTFARHLSQAVGVRICAVPTLDVIAQNAREVQTPPSRLAVVLDAKRGQVFAAIFEWSSDDYHRIVEPDMIEPATLLAESSSPIAVIGEGIDYHAAAIEKTNAQVLDRAYWPPRAQCVHRLGWAMACRQNWTDPAQLIPLYIRRPEAQELWEKRHGSG